MSVVQTGFKLLDVDSSAIEWTGLKKDFGIKNSNIHF